MTNEATQTQNKETVIYVNFMPKTKAVSATHFSADNMSPEEIYDLLVPRFGTAFTAWFVDQYKSQQA